MHTPIRALGLGLLLAVGAMPAGAKSKAAKTAPPAAPAATQPSDPLDLSLHPAAILPTTPIDLSLHPAAAPPSAPARLTLESATGSDEVKRVAHWIAESRDNAGLPYLLIDKVNAQVLAFTPAGQLRGATPALLGLAHGDRLLAPNSATMEQMPPNVRITPAGRFVSQLAIDSLGKELLVLDYDASISLHAVVKGTPKERRAERLASASTQDNRISFGCINVPGAFYSTVVSPAFTRTKGIVYVLPETRPAGELFGFQPASAAPTATMATATTVTAGAAQVSASMDAQTASAAAPGAVAK